MSILVGQNPPIDTGKVSLYARGTKHVHERDSQPMKLGVLVSSDFASVLRQDDLGTDKANRAPLGSVGHGVTPDLFRACRGPIRPTGSTNWAMLESALPG